MSETKHTPWIILPNVNFPGDYPIVAGTPEHYTTVCVIYNCDEDTANSIIRACNCHYDLLEACKAVIEHAYTKQPCPGWSHKMQMALGKARAAIAKVTP